MTTSLFSPIDIGAIRLTNRIVMAPLTRMRAPEQIPTALMTTYYQQRASAGLIIAEASQISPQGIGYPATPGLYNDEQVAGWKKITAAVHAQGGHIFAQLWHVGRISHPDLHHGELPVAPSAITPKGQAVTPSGYQPFVMPRALAIEEIPGIVNQYQVAAKNALEAGFDGVEVHSANGYLLDQFLRDGTNKRTDSYGGSMANRARFLFEVLEAVISVCGAERTGLRLSPSGTFNDISDSDPVTFFSYLLGELNRFNLAYLHIVDALECDIRHGAKTIDIAILRSAFKGILITCGGYDKARAEQTLAAGLADAVAFGQLYIANPDLVERFKQNAVLNQPDPSTFYGGNETGYTDYPFLAA